MEPKVLETVETVPATGDELLVELRAAEPETQAEFVPVTLSLTLDQASFLYEKLHRATVEDHRYRPESLRKPALTTPPALLQQLDDLLEEMPATTPVAADERGRVTVLGRTLTLKVQPHEARYLLQILKNKKRDGWRRENVERGLFLPLQVLEIAEDGEDERSGGAPISRPARQEFPEFQVHRAVLRKALKDLPRKLKMPAPEVKELLAAMMEAEGNVSMAARLIGQPQRKTARRIQRILAHFKSRGLSA